MNNWTEEQKEAIYTDNCNLLVAAAAGSGKTAVLVERIIEKVLNPKDPLDIDKLLVVTFTNAAAAEMKERIGDALAEKIEENPSNLRLQKQLALLSKSNIMTIHAFCLRVIRENFHSIDIDPSFRVGNENELSLLMAETIEELFEERYDSKNEKFLKLIESFGTFRTDDDVKNMVLELYRFSKSSPWYEEWLNDSAEIFNINDDFKISNTKFGEVLLNDLFIKLESATKVLENLKELSMRDSLLENFTQELIKEEGMIKGLLNCKDMEELKLELSEVSFKTVRGKKGADEELKNTILKGRGNVRDLVKEARASLCMDEKTMIHSIKTMYPIVRELVNLVLDFDKKYTLKKKIRGIIDFNDIEHMCLEILVEKDKDGVVKSTKISEIYKDYFKEILIDEYQDSNLVQEVILNSVSRVGKEKSNYTPNIFMVGDIKQSIYKFRQAKPELFLEKYNSYSNNEGEFRKIKLFKNFRSREQVLRATNRVFKGIMSKEVGELNYTKEEFLNLGADFKDELNEENNLAKTVDVNIIDLKESSIYNYDNTRDETEEDDEDLTSIELEARMIGNIIESLVNSESKVYDKNIKKYRKIEFKDIVILTRSAANSASVLVDELNNKNIPAFGDTGGGYFKTTEIKLIISLLEVVDNPLQDIPLLSVLRSPIGNFTSNELADIRMQNKNITMYECLKLIYEDTDVQMRLENNLVKKIKVFIENLNKWREASYYTPVDELVWRLYVETGIYGFVGALPGGEQRQANLRSLFTRAKAFEESSYKGLFDFINLINKLRNAQDMDIAKTIGENENVVRIMTIHKSKGLEFPIVILCNCGKRFNTSDLNKKILMHSDLGIGCDCVNLEKRISYPTIYKEIIKKKIKLENLSEEMRILYVALTRAKEKLIITSAVKDLSKYDENINVAFEGEETLSKNYVMNSKCYMDFIYPVAKKINYDNLWNIKVWNKNALQTIDESSENTISVLDTLNILKDSIKNYKYMNLIKDRLEFNYIFEKSHSIKSMITVSELKRKYELLEYKNEDINEKLVSLDELKNDIGRTTKISLKTPKFLKEEKGITGAEKGTLMHFVMQHIEIEKDITINYIKDKVKNMVKSNIITEEESKYIDIKKIYDFFNGELGRRLKLADYVEREVPFFIEINSTDVYPELDPKYKNEKIMLQGAIDCYFKEKGELVIIDYKTDYVNDIEELRDKYKEQLLLYKKSLERLTKKRVKESYIYSFYKNEYINVQLDF